LWYFVFSSVSAIWYLHSVCVQFLQKKIWSDTLSFASIKSGILTFLYFLQFDISVLSLQLFWYSSSLQFLQFGICIQFLQKKNLEWYFVFRFCKILYFDFSSASAMVSTTKEIIWLWWLLADMRVFFSHPTPMYCDNQSSIQIAHNSVFQANEAHWDRLSSYLSIISSMTPLLCLLFLLPCRFLYQDVFHLLFSFSSWQTLDACSCRIMSLRGDVK